MTTRTYTTNLNCKNCVAAVTPHLNGEKRIARWSVDTSTPAKVLTVEGNDVAPSTVEKLVATAGFRVLGETNSPEVAPAAEKPTSYFPIFLLFGFLILGVGLLEFRDGSFDAMRAMARFMGGFFLTFAFFKLLDLKGFALSYSSYDLVASRWLGYGYIYPFIELALGMAYVAGFQPTIANAITIGVMTASTLGVVKSLLQRRKIQCACLGTVFNLPMSYVTLTEDLLMVAMAGAMLIA